MVGTIQFTYDENSWPVFIGFNSASVKVQSKHSTSRLGVSKTLGILVTILCMSILGTPSTSRSICLLDKSKSNLHSAYWAYTYELIGLWNWRKCLRPLCHWHCNKQVSKCRASNTSKKLVKCTMPLAASVVFGWRGRWDAMGRVHGMWRGVCDATGGVHGVWQQAEV